MNQSLSKLTIWCTKLPNVKHGLLPPSVPRPNPLVVDSRVFVSVFAPGAIACLNRNTGEIEWKRKLPPFGADSVYYASGLVFARSTHTLYALAPDSGHAIWQFCPYGTHGEWIYSHPTVWRNRLFIGDRHGFLHCLDAKSGKPLWKRQTNRKHANANATPLVMNGLVVISTNAKTAIAFDAESGEPLWRRQLDGPASFGLLVHRRMPVIVADSVYLLKPCSGVVERKLKWRSESVEYVEDLGRNLAVVLRDPSDSGTTRISIFNLDNGKMKLVSHSAWCPTLRYVAETKISYLSHLRGVHLLDGNANTLAKISLPDDGVGLVDVKDEIIYLATARGRVLALRHPRSDGWHHRD